MMLRGFSGNVQVRHCEKLLRRSNPALLAALDCFAELAMTLRGRRKRSRSSFLEALATRAQAGTGTPCRRFVPLKETPLAIGDPGAWGRRQVTHATQQPMNPADWHPWEACEPSLRSGQIRNLPPNRSPLYLPLNSLVVATCLF
jgi:hypothetical protein